MAILRAAIEVGEDGLGKGGLVGYLVRLARTEPKHFARLPALVLPYQAGTLLEDSLKQIEYKIAEEVWQEMRARGLSPEILRDLAETEIKRAKREAAGESDQPPADENDDVIAGGAPGTPGTGWSED